MIGMKDTFLADVPFSDYVPFQPHSTTSREAAKAITGISGRDRQRVLDYLTQNKDGATDEQIGDALDMAGNTLRPRRRELQIAGHIIDSKRYALTASGRRATVWVLKPKSDQVTFSTLMPPV